MTDKARQRRKALAQQLGVGTRTAANILRSRRSTPPNPPPGVESAAASTVLGTFVSDGTSGSPDVGVFPGDGPGLGAFLRKYPTHYVFVEIEDGEQPRRAGRHRLGLAETDPPVFGGFVIDSFEYPPDTPRNVLLAEVERRNGPLRIQYPNGNLGESYRATPAGLEEACILCGLLARNGQEIRLLSSRGVMLKHWNPAPPTSGQPAARAAEGSMNQEPRQRATFRYVHVDHGTPYGTRWRLSEDADGARMRITVPEGPMTPKLAEEAFASAAFPLIVETSDDEGATWAHHPDESPKRDWPGAIHLLYALLGTGRWNVGRIRARSGEELVRHPPQLLKDIAVAIREAHPKARVMLRPPMDQLIVELPNRQVFAVAPAMRTPLRWPVYVTPVPPPRPEDGSWECATVEEVLSTLQWPQVQPSVRIASLAEIRAK
jgi:hypothetical protein